MDASMFLSGTFKIEKDKRGDELSTLRSRVGGWQTHRTVFFFCFHFCAPKSTGLHVAHPLVLLFLLLLPVLKPPPYTVQS